MTAGVHRLWSHKAFKARLPLRILLGVCSTIAYQNSIFTWARDHRVHHKYTETDADPVNSKRGFFFAHCGWLMCKKHPDVKRIGGKVDLSDILADPVVYYQKKYYMWLMAIFCVALPAFIPCYFWNESLIVAFMVPVFLRYIAVLNVTWLVNSAGHMFGNRPYDIHMAPTDNYGLSTLTLGECWHNFHHAFPWDYRTSEWGWDNNLTTILLDLFTKIGWAYDLKEVTKEHIQARIKRTGPGTRQDKDVREYDF